MKFYMFFVTALLIIMGLPCLSSAEMSSASYKIPTNVMSGGGAPMGSGNFQNNATLGQPSPLGITSSTSYDLYPGFWYTISITGCVWDSESDGDVDGTDLFWFIDSYTPSDLESFANEFGSTDCF